MNFKISYTNNLTIGTVTKEQYLEFESSDSQGERNDAMDAFYYAIEKIIASNEDQTEKPEDEIEFFMDGKKVEYFPDALQDEEANAEHIEPEEDEQDSEEAAEAATEEPESESAFSRLAKMFRPKATGGIVSAKSVDREALPKFIEDFKAESDLKDKIDDAISYEVEALAELKERMKTEGESNFDEMEKPANIEVFVHCESCFAENFCLCYETNSYIKCPNCRSKMHIRPATKPEADDLNVSFVANRKFRTAKERYEYKMNRGAAE